jgi:hypothetical protein
MNDASFIIKEEAKEKTEHCDYNGKICIKRVHKFTNEFFGILHTFSIPQNI